MNLDWVPTEQKNKIIEAYNVLKSNLQGAYLVRVHDDIGKSLPVEIEGWHNYVIKSMKVWGDETWKKSDGITATEILCGIHLVIIDKGLIKVVATLDQG